MKAKTDAKGLALDDGVVEDLELAFSGGNDDWQEFWETPLVIDENGARASIIHITAFLLPKMTSMFL